MSPHPVKIPTKSSTQVNHAGNHWARAQNVSTSPQNECAAPISKASAPATYGHSGSGDLLPVCPTMSRSFVFYSPISALAHSVTFSSKLAPPIGEKFPIAFSRMEFIFFNLNNYLYNYNNRNHCKNIIQLVKFDYVLFFSEFFF